jgi:hypothetical protein
MIMLRMYWALRLPLQGVLHSGLSEGDMREWPTSRGASQDVFHPRHIWPEAGLS